MEGSQKSFQDRSKPRLWAPVAIILIAVIIMAVAVMRGGRNPNRFFNAKIISAVNFPLYYPNKLPEGYSIDKSSAKLENQILLFSISDKTRTISMSEQVIPKAPPDLSVLVKSNPSFIKINVPAGEAVVGVNPAGQSPVAIVETNTTLISLSGTKDTPLDVMNKLAQSLNSVPQ